MNFNILYSLATDLIDKRSIQLSNNNDYVCVLATQNNSIFTGVTGSTVENGKLVPVCAETETIKIMLSSGESKITALVLVNCNTRKPCLPCDKCKKLILDINFENNNCLIMQPDKSFVRIMDLKTNSANLEDLWESGWNDDDIDTNYNNNISNPFNNVQTMPVTPNINDRVTQSMDISFFQNSMNVSPFHPQSSMYTSNPMPQSPVSNGNMSVMGYQAKQLNSLSNKSSVYMETIHSTSTLQTVMIEKSNSTFAKANENISNNSDTSNSRFKELLKDIIDDTSKDNENSQPMKDKFEVTNFEPITNNNKQELLSKKEIKAMAKERKKQAKKNIKIMQSIEKRSRT